MVYDSETVPLIVVPAPLAALLDTVEVGVVEFPSVPVTFFFFFLVIPPVKF